jgi:hypothetical protein
LKDEDGRAASELPAKCQLKSDFPLQSSERLRYSSLEDVHGIGPKGPGGREVGGRAGGSLCCAGVTTMSEQGEQGALVTWNRPKLTVASRDASSSQQADPRRPKSKKGSSRRVSAPACSPGVRTITSSICLSRTWPGAPARGSSIRPATASSRKRRRHLPTVARATRTRRANRLVVLTRRTGQHVASPLRERRCRASTLGQRLLLLFVLRDSESARPWGDPYAYSSLSVGSPNLHNTTYAIKFCAGRWNYAIRGTSPRNRGAFGAAPSTLSGHPKNTHIVNVGTICTRLAA